MNDDLGEFIEVCLPRLKYAIRRNNNDEMYAFKQGFFYQLEHHFPAEVRISVEAEKRANVIGLAGLGGMKASEAWGRFKNREFSEQLKSLGKESLFRHRRRTSKCFHYEHVLTGRMLWIAINGFHGGGNPEARDIEQYVRKNLCVAWVLPEEDARLEKSERGKNLRDALEHYRAVGIEFVKEMGPGMSLNRRYCYISILRVASTSTVTGNQCRGEGGVLVPGWGEMRFLVFLFFLFWTPFRPPKGLFEDRWVSSSIAFHLVWW